MFKKFSIGCLGIVALVFVLGVIGSFGSSGGDSRPQAGPSTTGSTASGKVTEATKPAGGAEAPKATAKPTEGPKLGSSRSAAVPFGQPLTMTQGDKTFEIRVLEVQKDATALVKKANSLNSDPKEGMAYVAVKMRLSYLKGPVDKPYHTPTSGASLFAQSRMWGVEGLPVPPKPELGGIDIFPGATVEGWITPLQAPRAAMDEIILSWGKDLLGGGETWFALDGEKADAGPLPSLQAPPPPTSSTPGATRGSPVPLGQTVKVGDGKSSFEVSVIQVERNASALVKKANSFNSDPLQGTEYLAVKMRLKYLTGSQDKPVRTPTSGTSVFALNRMWGTGIGTVPPSPAFGGQDIFPGAVVEGWLTPVMVSKEGMDEAVLSYGKDLFGGGETWFALR